MWEFRNFELKWLHWNMGVLQDSTLLILWSNSITSFIIIAFIFPDHKHIVFSSKHRNWEIHPVKNKAQTLDSYIQCWGPKPLFQHSLGNKVGFTGMRTSAVTQGFCSGRPAEFNALLPLSWNSFLKIHLFICLFVCLIGREEGREGERHQFVIPLTYGWFLVDSFMCPDVSLNPKPWQIETTL